MMMSALIPSGMQENLHRREQNDSNKSMAHNTLSQ